MIKIFLPTSIIWKLLLKLLSLGSHFAVTFSKLLGPATVKQIIKTSVYKITE